MKIIELTEENQSQYIDKVANLEIKVLENMEKSGKVGQLFITGKDDILEYIKSKENKVLVAVNPQNEVVSAVYITQGQEPFTYNDITKYFKASDNYKQYVKNSYSEIKDYKVDMLDLYKTKLDAFDYAKSKILANHSEFNNITEYIAHEKNTPNGFDEKNELRDNLNKYMSEYVYNKAQKTGNDSLIEKYENFYWTTWDDILNELNLQTKKIKRPTILEYENFLNEEHLKIHSSSINTPSTYFNANTSNSIEIDTYITDPDNRHSGLARILVFEGLKMKLKENFEEGKKDDIYLCSTLHKQNLSSKYVSEFFGLKDNLFVNRRTGRDREVHICKINKENYNNYLNNMEDKLIVLYGYNPSNKELSSKRTKEVLQEQLSYELNEYRRLNRIRHTNKNYKGFESIQDIIPKLNRIGQLKNRIKQFNEKQTEEQGGEER